MDSIDVTMILVLISTLIIRGVDLYFFLKRVSLKCHKYDWDHVNHNDLLLLSRIIIYITAVIEPSLIEENLL